MRLVAPVCVLALLALWLRAAGRSRRTARGVVEWYEEGLRGE